MQLPIDAPATVFDAFARAAARHGHKPFLAMLPETAQAYGLDAGETSYRDALGKIAALTDGYSAKGYGNGHRVGILMEKQKLADPEHRAGSPEENGTEYGKSEIRNSKSETISKFK